LNGVIGASVGAAVAVFVLRKTIKTQRQLFAIERAQNYTATQLADHRRGVELKQQLDAQREDVRLQLEFQAREASRQRELAAIADLLAAANAMLKRYKQGQPAIEELILQGDAAAMRWRMEMTHESLAKEIWPWSHHLGELAMNINFELEHSGEDSKPALAAFDALLDAVAELELVAMSWPNASHQDRDELSARLIAERTKWES